MKSLCPCFSKKPYANCCQAIHQGNIAKSAEQLMRARYSAYVLKIDTFLRDSWHTSTKPNNLTHASLIGIKWLGLTILDTQLVDASHATVTFKAQFKMAKGKTQTMHETSQFIFENGRWLYVDGEVISA